MLCFPVTIAGGITNASGNDQFRFILLIAEKLTDQTLANTLLGDDTAPVPVFDKWRGASRIKLIDDAFMQFRSDFEGYTVLTLQPGDEYKVRIEIDYLSQGVDERLIEDARIQVTRIA